MSSPLRSSALSWAFLAVVLAGAATAQVPQDMTYTGRLVDSVGDPLPGPVDLQLRIFDAETAGSELYSEQHLATPLDATGAFAVQLGLGSNPSAPFDADLFADVDRWLEVVVDGQVLEPRPILASVPWVRVAQQANKIVPDPNGPFEDCGDGSVADPKTGLQWEKKTGSAGGAPDFSDPHEVDNDYAWSNSGTDPDGDAFSDFLATLNDPTGGVAATPADTTGCFARTCDWRLPTSVELQTILDCSFADCIDPVFGPTGADSYWSSSEDAGNASQVWAASFGTGVVSALDKSLQRFTRAVRTGACR